MGWISHRSADLLYLSLLQSFIHFCIPLTEEGRGVQRRIAHERPNWFIYCCTSSEAGKNTHIPSNLQQAIRNRERVVCTQHSPVKQAT